MSQNIIPSPIPWPLSFQAGARCATARGRLSLQMVNVRQYRCAFPLAARIIGPSYATEGIRGCRREQAVGAAYLFECGFTSSGAATIRPAWPMANRHGARYERLSV